tara:strand:+ start:384 stop:866 length:483 start_codon:yes stop_codon:yes gene_type:complete
MKENKKTNKQFTQTEKAKRGWWFSVFFMILVVCLIIFLSFVKIQEDNRDVLVGLIGMITGAVSSMLAIASGRDPSEVEELKDKLSSANADRAALIARLRDCQIQLQLKNEQVFELQTAVIDKLSMFTNSSPIKTKTTENIVLHDDVETWIPKVDREENIK